MESDEDGYIGTANDDIKKDKKYTLETARIVLLSEILRYLNKRSIRNKKDIVCNTLFNSEAFLPSKDILSIFIEEKNIENELKEDVLPLAMMKFWKDIIFLLHEKDLLEALIIKLLQLIDNEEVEEEKRLLASLWISSLSYSFLKLDAAHCMSRVLEYQLGKAENKLSPRDYEFKVRMEIDRAYPHLKDVLWFNLSDTVLPCLTDIKFISKLILHVNEFSIKFIIPILELLSPKISKDSKQVLLNLVSIYAMGRTNDDTSPSECEKTFTIEDLQHGEHILNIDTDQNEVDHKVPRFLCDQTVRNNYWKFTMCKYSVLSYFSATTLIKKNCIEIFFSNT